MARGAVCQSNGGGREKTVCAVETRASRVARGTARPARQQGYTYLQVLAGQVELHLGVRNVDTVGRVNRASASLGIVGRQRLHNVRPRRPVVFLFLRGHGGRGARGKQNGSKAHLQDQQSVGEVECCGAAKEWPSKSASGEAESRGDHSTLFPSRHGPPRNASRAKPGAPPDMEGRRCRYA